MTKCSTGVELSVPLARRIHVGFDQGHITENAGLLLLQQLDQHQELTKSFARALREWRDPRFIVHSIHDLVRSRVFAIAQGYEDGNDFAVLRDEPLFKVACERGVEGVPLPSQPSVSRFERRALPLSELESARKVLVQHAITRWKRTRRRPQELVLDLDSTDDPTHGQQEFTAFNGYYDAHCYLQLFIFTREGDLLWTKLVPGTANVRLWAQAGLKEVVTELRAAFPEIRLSLRADNGFAGPELYEYCEQQNLGYVINCGTHRKLCEQVSHLEKRAEALFQEGAEKTPVQVLSEFDYQASSWKKSRRIVAKAQRTLIGPDLRFVVTNLSSPPVDIYDFYAGRGQMENWIKDLKRHVKSDRLSATTFAANELRLLLYGLAYQLLHLLRQLGPESIRFSQLATLRQRLLRVPALVKKTARKLWVNVSRHFAWQREWRQVARVLTR